MLEEIKSINLEKKTKEYIKMFYTNCILLKTNELGRTEQKEYIKEIKKRKIVKNIKARNLKQLIKKILLNISIKLYLKMRWMYENVYRRKNRDNKFGIRRRK